MELHTGRPDSMEGRLDKEIKSYDLLDSLGLEYYQVDHEAAETMEACKEIDEVLGASICKNLFLTNKQGTEYYLLLMPEDKPFKTKELSAQINSARLSFATPEDMERLLNLTPGSVSILGLMFDTANAVTLLIDRDLLKSRFIGVHPCINTASVKLRSRDAFGPLVKAMHHDKKFVDLKGE